MFGASKLTPSEKNSEDKSEALIVSLSLAPNGWLACSEKSGKIEFFDPNTYKLERVFSFPYRFDWKIFWNP